MNKDSKEHSDQKELSVEEAALSTPREIPSPLDLGTLHKLSHSELVNLAATAISPFTGIHRNII